MLLSPASTDAVESRALITKDLPAVIVPTDREPIAVDPFTPDYAAARCGVPAEDIVAAARMFAAGPTGTSGSGTGPSMSPHASLMEHLSACLNVVCGRFLREGQQMDSGGLLPPATPKRASRCR